MLLRSPVPLAKTMEVQCLLLILCLLLLAPSQSFSLIKLHFFALSVFAFLSCFAHSCQDSFFFFWRGGLCPCYGGYIKMFSFQLGFI